MNHLQRKVILAQTDHGQVRRTYWVNPESAMHDLIFSKRANEGVDHALEAIAKVRGIPADLKRVPIKVTRNFGAEGRYLVYNPWGAP